MTTLGEAAREYEQAVERHQLGGGFEDLVSAVWWAQELEAATRNLGRPDEALWGGVWRRHWPRLVHLAGVLGVPVPDDLATPEDFA